MKSILFVASEASPFIKTGGLADVLGSLPLALSKKGNDISVILPLYGQIIEKYMEELEVYTEFKVQLAKYNADTRVFKIRKNGVKFLFVENREYFERPSIYGYDDDGERFSFFSHAVYQTMINMDMYPDVIHSNDWQSGMIPALAKIFYSSNKKIAKIKQIFTIHNIAYQGNFPSDMLESCLGISREYYDNGDLRFKEGISFMKSAIVYADKISTVSNTYSYEILEDYYGEGMQHILRLRKDDLWGITNGIEEDEFNPRKDKDIFKRYSERSLYGKGSNKLSLQGELGLKQRKDVCLVAMVSRLTWQKGISLVLNKMSEIMNMDVQLVILGTGEHEYEHHLANSENAYKTKMVYYKAYSEELAKKIYAASDLFLMPSMFEPCGISQLIAMRFGSIPLVRETGGLIDTIEPYNEFEDTGWGFRFTNFHSEDFFHVFKMAVNLYYKDKKSYSKIQKRAMQVDVSWEKSAELYLKMYKAK